MAYRNKRRRNRTQMPLASQSAVRAILAQLKAEIPRLNISSEKDWTKLLQAVKHLNRYRATSTKRGRPSPWQREDLILTQSKLSQILEHVSQNRISVSTFIDHLLPLLNFPQDILDALESGKINLFEANHLARIKPGRNNFSNDQAEEKRKELLAVHLTAKLSGARLRQRVNEILSAKSRESREISLSPILAIEEEQALEDFDPYDPSHLFWEEIKNLGFAFREIKREDLDDDLLNELLNASEPLWGVLEKIKRRKTK